MPSITDSPNLLLTALRIELVDDTFQGTVSPYPGDENYRELQIQPDPFVYSLSHRSQERQVLSIPLTSETTALGPANTPLNVADYMGPLAALIEKRLPDLFPDHELEQVRFGVRRLRQKDDIVNRALQRIGVPRSPRLAGLRKLPETRFSVRCLHLSGESVSLALTMEFHVRSELSSTAAELHRLGVDLSGLVMVDAREKGPPLGVVVRVEGEKLVLRNLDQHITVAAGDCRPEPSSATVRNLLEQSLRPNQLAAYRDAESVVQAERLSGEAFQKRLHDIADYFAKRGELAAAPSVRLRFGPLLRPRVGGRQPQAVRLPPVRYCFEPDRSALEQFPARGLERYGPFDKRRFDKKSPRILIVFPDEAQGDVETFTRQLFEGLNKEGVERFARGFQGIYHLARIIPKFLPVQLPRGSSLNVGRTYADALSQNIDPSRAPDLALIIIRDEDAFIERDNPYLTAKAALLGMGIPSQEVRLQTVRQRPKSIAFTLENMAAAMYAKLGGAPWTVEPTMPLAQELIVGVDCAEIGNRFEVRERYMGITTVFASDGTYVLAAPSPRCHYDDYPRELTSTVTKALKRASVLQGWQEGDRVRLVAHMGKPPRNTDVAAVMKAAMAELEPRVQFEAAFLTIKDNHPFKVVAPGERGRERVVEIGGRGHANRLVGVHLPERGTLVDLGPRKRLLCVNGPSQVKREGEAFPQPLMIELHPASTYRDMNALSKQVLDFTGLSWRSMLPVRHPVTLYYSHLIADLVGKLERVPGWSDKLLDTLLVRSRWFL